MTHVKKKVQKRILYISMTRLSFIIVINDVHHVSEYLFENFLISGSTNLVGKFTQSVRRIVQDVKDEGTATGATKEEVIETNERLRAVRVRMDESYDTAKKALVGLMTKYNDSKNVHNIFQRYNMLKAMIKVR